MPKIMVQVTETLKAAFKADAPVCVATTPLAAAVHDVYRKLGLCECAVSSKG